MHSFSDTDNKRLIAMGLPAGCHKWDSFTIAMQHRIWLQSQRRSHAAMRAVMAACVFIFSVWVGVQL